MNENYLKIIFIIDESGSMQGTEKDVIGGFNHFIEQQKKGRTRQGHRLVVQIQQQLEPGRERSPDR